MPWYVYLAHFFAGAFLANAVPHLVQGICGNKFQTPFARPRGIGESSAVVNVVWGMANLAIGTALALGVGPFAGTLAEWVVLFAGALVISVFLAKHFGAVRKGPPSP